MALEVETAAGARQLVLIGEVAVDRDPADPRTLGDFGEGGGRGADRLVQLDRGLDDAPTGLLLELGAAL